jgi:hypothetical protein
LEKSGYQSSGLGGRNRRLSDSSVAALLVLTILNEFEVQPWVIADKALDLSAVLGAGNYVFV